MRIVLALAIVGLRLTHLTADPPAWLSWSSGLYSDEGIYAGDARSLALFGRWCIGDFHSAEVAPLHTLLLWCLFRLFGVSLATDRTLSVLTSLLTLGLFYLTLKRRFDEETAWAGFVLLGLSPVYLFYNRLGLLETPTVCLLVAAMYCAGFPRLQWSSGLILAAAAVYKPLALLCAPGLLYACPVSKRNIGQRLTGLIAGIALDAAVWQFPHRHDLARLNRYYLLHQYLPASAAGLMHNLARNLWSGSSDGIALYVIRFAPLLTALLLLSIGQSRRGADRLLSDFWLSLGVPAIALCLMSYAPSRYYILFWPAFTAIAASALSKLPRPGAAGALCFYVIWSGTVIVWSLRQETFNVQTAALALSAYTSPGDLVAGQYAPELCLSGRQNCLYVQPGIANTRTDVHGALVLVTRLKYWDHYWKSERHLPIMSKPAIEFELPHRQTVDGFYTIANSSSMSLKSPNR